MKGDEATPAVTYDVIVIGGGASGLMAAGVAASRGARILLLEKSHTLGIKLAHTGGGRCNITNALFNTRAILAHYGSAEQYLYSAFAQFDVQSTFDFFAERGLPLVIEERGRAFPETQHAGDVVRVLTEYCHEGHVTIRTHSGVTRILTNNKKVLGVETSHGVTEYAPSIILATGGLSHKEMGATGDGFTFLRELGHAVEPPTPTLVPLAVAEPWVKVLSGSSLSHAKIHFYLDGKKKFTKEGPLLYTHFGISGPTILNSAHAVADLLKAGTVTARVDAFPHQDEQALDVALLGIFDTNKNKELKNVLAKFLPEGMLPALSLLFPMLDVSTRVHSVTLKERKQIIRTLKALPLTITHLMGFDRAIVADGGVRLSDIDTRTMESRHVAGLFVSGDLLHINRPSGGFSLQLCWTTGYVAGIHAVSHSQ